MHGAGTTSKSASRASRDIGTVKSQHRLLVMQQDSIIVAVPLMLSGQAATVQEAKAAIMLEVQQLVDVLQSIYKIVPTEHG